MNCKSFVKVALFGLFMVGSLHAQVGVATKITTSFTAAQYPAGTPNCSATMTTNCAAGYTLTITPPTGSAIVIPNCTTAVTTNCIAATATSYTYTSPTALNYGTYSFSLVTNAVGTTSTTLLTSTPSTKGAVYAPNPITVAPAPGGIVVTFQ